MPKADILLLKVKQTKNTKRSMLKDLHRILRSPDAVESADPLDTNVNDIDTSYPILPASQYQFKLEGCKREPTRDNDGERLTIPHKLTEAAQDKKGEPVAPGHQITSYIGLTERLGVPGKQDYTINSIKKSIARLAKAAGVNATVRAIIDNPSILDGKVVIAKVRVNKETAEFPESNSIGGYVEN